MTTTEILNIILKTMVIVVVSVIVLDPEAAGEWQAKRDIAYDAIWSEWIMDCDCTETVE